MTHLSQPAFAEWKSRHPTWAAATIARMKDEEVLVKRRTKIQDKPNDHPPKGRGRGSSKGAETSEKS